MKFFLTSLQKKVPQTKGVFITSKKINVSENFTHSPRPPAEIDSLIWNLERTFEKSLNPSPFNQKTRETES